MPTYDYRCSEGHRFERFQRMSAAPVAECPSCGARAERILSAGAGFLFKGKGFYITDHRSESYRKAAEAEKSAAAGTSGDKAKSGDGGKKASPSGDGASPGPAASSSSKASASANPAKPADGAR